MNAWQATPSAPPDLHLPPREELVNTLEFGAQAERVLPADVFRKFAGSDRAPFDRITFRPRMMVNCVGLDMTAELFGLTLFAPIIVAPMADQRLVHAEAELATVRGASRAKAAVVLSAASSTPLQAAVQDAATPLFCQVFAADGASRTHAQARAAVDAGCKAVFLTVGVAGREGRPAGRIPWSAVDGLRHAVAAPVVIKGIMTVEDAKTAVKAGAQAIVVSTYGQAAGAGRGSPLDLLPAVADAVGGDVPVLVDGGFRRGTDIMKALALGARAVLVGRPVMWGLAAYGADGVQAVLELLQTELGRVMGCCGAPNLAAISRALVTVHRATS